jgi:hypothetical protein
MVNLDMVNLDMVNLDMVNCRSDEFTNNAAYGKF